jgi:hypothetical protein
MRRERRGAIPPDIEELRNRIESWRATRKRGSPMPEELWAKAVELAGTHGLYVVARDSTVDYGALKLRGEGAAAGEQRELPGAVEFVEVAASRLLERREAGRAVVELARRDGAKLTVRLEGGARLDVVALTEAFLRRGREP